MNHNWGSFCKVALAALALLFVAESVSAGWAFGYYDNDWSVEVLSGGHWSAYSEPYYTYNYGDYYYFDTPYRINYSGNYYNYEPGWYNGNNRYWYNNTPVYNGERYWYGESYGYYYSPSYAPSYYYWGGNWNYYPDWVGVYGPAYYGNAYYWPAGGNNYYSGAYSGGTAYYGPAYTVSHGGGYGSGRNVGYGEYTGYNYKYPQGAYCTEINLSADDFYITAGEKEYATVTVANRSKKNFRMQNVSVYIDGFDVMETGKDFDSSVPSGGSRDIKVRLEAISTAASDDISANVKVSGVFTDGTNCSPGDIGAAEFTIHVSGKSKQSRGKSGDYDYARSSSSYEPKNTGENSWKDVSVSTGEYSTGASQSKGSGTSTYPPQGNCYSLGFENRAGVSVDAGESAYADIYLKNYSALNFYIDSVDVEEYATTFSASGYVKDSVVLKGDRARVGFWIYSDEAKKDDTGTIYITANGHFSSGVYCAIRSNATQVYVKGNKTANFSALDFGFEFPEQAEVDNSKGGIGYIELKIDNPFDEDATITLAGEDVDVFPQTINIPQQTYTEKVVRISNLSRDVGFVVYRIEVNGETVIEKYTRVVEGENGYWPEGNTNENNGAGSGNGSNNGSGAGSGNGNQNNNAGSGNGNNGSGTGNDNNGSNGSGSGSSGSGSGTSGTNSGTSNTGSGSGNEGAGNGTSFTGLAGTAFAVLNGNALNIGLGILVLTMLWMVYRASAGRRVGMPRHTCTPKTCSP